MNEPDLQRHAREAVQGPPNGYFVVVPAIQDYEVLDFATLYALLESRWKFLLGATLFGAALAAGVALLMQPIYRAEVVIAPKTQGPGALNSLSEELGGLAALAGVELGDASDRKEESIATLGSRGFARDFIAAEKLMPVLFEERWDARAGRWREDVKVPTLEAGVKKFTDDVRAITEDRKSGLITLTVEWNDAEASARWANRMVDTLNERLRARAISEAERNTEYLNQELLKTSVVELRQAIYRLIQEQVNNAMLANVQRDYAFRVIDPAVPPETRARPKRTLMTLVGAVLGFTVGFIVVLAKHRIGRQRGT